MPSIHNLVSTNALTAVENEILDVSNLVKKTDYDTKANEIEKKITNHNHDKYITTPEFNKLTAEHFAARLARENLVTKADFDDKLKHYLINHLIYILINHLFIKSFNKKHLIVENGFKKLEASDSIYLCGKGHFEDDGTQYYLVFQTVSRYFKTISANNSNILTWKSKGLADESIKPPSTTNNIRNTLLDYGGTKIKV